MSSLTGGPRPCRCFGTVTNLSFNVLGLVAHPVDHGYSPWMSTSASDKQVIGTCASR